jgi:hypothetical protein
MEERNIAGEVCFNVIARAEEGRWMANKWNEWENNTEECNGINKDTEGIKKWDSKHHGDLMSSTSAGLSARTYFKQEFLQN